MPSASGQRPVVNGIEGSVYEHNDYTETFGITLQLNHFGPLRAGCLGNNVKDRSAGAVIRCNWIESGNRQLDLVDSDGSSPTVFAGVQDRAALASAAIDGASTSLAVYPRRAAIA